MGGGSLNLSRARRVFAGMRRAVVLAVLTLLALPATASAQGIISSLSVNPSQVRDGASAQGTVNLAFPDLQPVTALRSAAIPASRPSRRAS